MARLRSHDDGRACLVTARLLVGRSPACGLRVLEPHASSEHAVVQWTGRGWQIIDQSSRNGTFLNGRSLQPGVPAPLEAGSEIAFGDPHHPWTFEDDRPPQATAIHVATDQVIEARNGRLVLPSEQCPELLIRLDPAGRWTVQLSDGTTREVKDQEIVQTQDGGWQIQLP